MLESVAEAANKHQKKLNYKSYIFVTLP